MFSFKYARTQDKFRNRVFRLIFWHSLFPINLFPLSIIIHIPSAKQRYPWSIKAYSVYATVEATILFLLKYLQKPLTRSSYWFVKGKLH